MGRKRGGLFDFNRDGKESIGEMYVAYQMYQKWLKRKEAKETGTASYAPLLMTNQMIRGEIFAKTDLNLGLILMIMIRKRNTRKRCRRLTLQRRVITWIVWNMRWIQGH